MERSLRVLHHGNQKIRIFSKNLILNFDLHFDLFQRAEIEKVSPCTYMTKSGMHRRPFEGRHLVFFYDSLYRKNYIIKNFKVKLEHVFLQYK